MSHQQPAAILCMIYNRMIQTMTNECFDEKIDEIVKFAEKNNKSISTKIFLDILKDRESDFPDAVIEQAMERLHELGVALKSEEDDEGYPAEEPNTDTFIPAEVNIVARNINVYNLMERLEHDEIDLAPDFQRNKDLWSLEAQSRLIESLMLKIPIPAFYFDAAKEDKWVVIDGLQRLTAFLNFLVGTKTGDAVDGEPKREKQKLSGLQYLEDFNGCTFDELPRQYARRIKETSLVAYTVEKGTPDDIVFNIFQRINTGGMVLTAQEIRQALYRGMATKLIEKLAAKKAFIAATQGAIRTDRMQDREYVTRYIAFTELDYTQEYKENIDNFLIKAMREINDHYDDADMVRIEENFERVMTYCMKIFGKYAFRRFSKNRRRGPINKAVFEMWSVCFSKLADEELEQLAEKREAFFEAYEDMQLKPAFITDIGSGSQSAVVRRIEAARDLVRKFV